MLKIALLTLTLTADGDPRLTVTDSEDLQSCRHSKEMVDILFEDGGIETMATVCGTTELTLSPFEHGATADREIHLYRVEILDEEAYSVTPLTKGDACTPTEGIVFCARSSQEVLQDAQD